MKSEFLLKKDLIQVCHLMYQKGFIAATDGNVSIRSDKDRVLFTPSGVSKGFLQSTDLIVTDLKGNKISGSGKPSTELFLHLEAYKKRADISAVVHAHPPYTVATTFAGINLSDYLLPEVIVSLEKVPIAPYALTGTTDLAKSFGSFIDNYDAVILEKHGLVTVGKDVFDAFFKLDKVEHNAHVVIAAKQIGNIYPLSEKQIADLLNLRKKSDK